VNLLSEHTLIIMQHPKVSVQIFKNMQHFDINSNLNDLKKFNKLYSLAKKIVLNEITYCKI